MNLFSFLSYFQIQNTKYKIQRTENKAIKYKNKNKMQKMQNVAKVTNYCID